MMNPKDWRFHDVISLPYCKDCLPKIKNALENSNRMLSVMGSCDTIGPGPRHTSQYINIAVKNSYFSHNLRKWFFTNDERRRLIKELSKVVV
jgi:hypothetical protein